MLIRLTEFGSAAAKWLNDNQGVLAVALFVATIAFGWLTGIFSALRKKPRFRIKILPGPTFCSTFLTGKKYEQYDVHRSAFALYLEVTNVGSSASSIAEIQIGYHWEIAPISWQWFRYTFGWFWLTQPAVNLTDFQVKIGENVKVYPFLLQRSSILGSAGENFLEPGRSLCGVVYFEQPDNWGACFPKAKDGMVKIKMRITDAFGRSHTVKSLIPALSLDEARKYNPTFGTTFKELRGETIREVDISRE
jgi:hypothetical protein